LVGPCKWRSLISRAVRYCAALIDSMPSTTCVPSDTAAVGAPPTEGAADFGAALTGVAAAAEAAGAGGGVGVGAVRGVGAGDGTGGAGATPALAVSDE